MNFLKNTDNRYLKIAVYAGVTIVASVLAILFLYSMRGYFLQIWQLLVAILRPLILGCMLCYLFYPIVEWIDRRLQALCRKTHWTHLGRHTRTLAILLMMLMIIAVVALFVVIIITTMTRSIQHIDLAYLQSMLTDSQTELSGLIQQGVDYLNAQGFQVSNLGALATKAISATTAVVSTTFFGFIFMIYFLADGKNISGYWKRAAKKVLPARSIQIMKELAADADRCCAGYIRGQSLDALIVGVETSLIFALIGMPYAPLVGLITGIGNLIPYVGPILGFAAVIVINLLRFDIRMLIIGFVVLCIIMFIDSNIVNPRLLANAIQVHPLLVVASLLAGSAIGGLIGALVSVPCGAFVKLQFEKWMRHRKSHESDAQMG